MADENNSGLSQAANAAHTVQGAVKTGKAVSAAAKGAAAGGPYGAVAGALWGNRKTVVKIVAAAAVLLLLPILFILMLPSLIFGGLKNAFSPESTAAPILNDNAAIIENMNNITFSLNSLLAEGIADVTARLDADFAVSGGNQKAIINPYETDLLYNANLFVSQYCAAKDKDVLSVSLADMESVLRAAKEHLYTFTRAPEIRQAIADNPDTVEIETVDELWMLYTITYNGEAYFADNVFHLTDEQKALSLDYAQNLSVFLGDGAVQNLTSSEYGYISYEGVTFTGGATPVVYYNQGDARYANEPFGTDDIGHFGCGPTSMAIVVSSLTSSTVDPAQMAKWAYDNGYWCSKSGSYHALIPAAAKHWGLPVEGCTASEPQRIVDALASGKLVVALMTKGHFTNSGHFIVLRGVTSGGKILVADPGNYGRSEKEWDLSIILNEASRRADAGGPFWIIG